MLLTAVVALAGCADEGSILTLELASIEAHACDCGASSSMAIDAFFLVHNDGTEPGTVTPNEIGLYDASNGMLLIRYGEVGSALELEDGGTPPVWDGVAPPGSDLRVRFVVRTPAVPAGVADLQLSATVSLQINGVARSYDSDGPIELYYRTM